MKANQKTSSLSFSPSHLSLLSRELPPTVFLQMMFFLSIYLCISSFIHFSFNTLIDYGKNCRPCAYSYLESPGGNRFHMVTAV